jgi:hypothetical protein
VGLGGFEASFVPIGADHGVDVEALFGGDGAVGVVVGLGEGVVFGGVFAGEDDGLGLLQALDDSEEDLAKGAIVSLYWSG